MDATTRCLLETIIACLLAVCVSVLFCWCCSSSPSASCLPSSSYRQVSCMERGAHTQNNFFFYLLCLLVAFCLEWNGMTINIFLLACLFAIFFFVQRNRQISEEND